jgi:hypothetical protein
MSSVKRRLACSRLRDFKGILKFDDESRIDGHPPLLNRWMAAWQLRILVARKTCPRIAPGDDRLPRLGAMIPGAFDLAAQEILLVVGRATKGKNSTNSG